MVQSGRPPKKAIVFGLLSSICLVYFSDILTGSRLFTERDLAVFFIPPRILWVNMIKSGHIPLWNPYCYFGQPLLAALQPGILYPPNILLILFPFDFAFNAVIVLHFILGGLFTYMLVKGIRGSDTGALISGVAFMLSGYLLSVHNLLTHLFSVIWLPLVLLCYHRYLLRKNVRSLVWAAVCLALMFLGGGIEILYGTFIVILTLLLFSSPFGVDAPPLPWKTKLWGCGLTGMLFLILSAVQLLPFMELAFHSTRVSGLPYREAIIWSFDYKDLFQFFLPDPYGYGSSTEKYWHNQCWLKTVYLGIIPFAFSLFYVAEKRRKSFPFLLVLLVSLVLSLGGNTPVYKFLFDYVPVFNTFRYPVKFLFIFVFFVSVMAGLGYDSFSRQVESRNRSAGHMVRLLLLVSFLAAILWGILNFYEAPIHTFLKQRGFLPPRYNYLPLNIHNAKRFLLFCLLFGPVLMFGWSKPKRGRLFSSAVLILLALDLFFANQGYYRAYDASRYHKPSESTASLKKDSSLFRVITSPKTMTAHLKQSDIFCDSVKFDKERMVPGFNLEPGVYTADGQGVITLGNVQKMLTLMYTAPQADSTNLLSLMNVKYVINKYEMLSKEFRLAHVIGEKNDPEGALRIYENLKVLPRTFLVREYKVVNSEEEYRKTLQSKAFDPARVVLLDESPLLKGLPLKGNTVETRTQTPFPPITLGLSPTEGGAKILKYEPNRVELATVSFSPGLLFLSDSYFPGWKAYVNGREEKIYRADYAFRAVPVPAGCNKVEFVYRPKSVIFGAGLSLIGIVTCVILYRREPNKLEPILIGD